MNLNRHPLQLRWRKTTGARTRGMSLVELMVGLSIGLVLTLGLFTMIANTSQTFKVQDDFARMQENATAALRYIGESLRSAGFYGYARQVGTIRNPAPVNTVNDCGSTGGAIENPPAANWALDFATPLAVYSDLTSANVAGVFPCILNSNFSDGNGTLPAPENANPILVARSAFGFRVPDPNADGNLIDAIAAQFQFANTLYVQSDPNAGLIFLGSQFAGLKAAATTRLTSAIPATDVDIFEYRTSVFYIRPCSRPGAGLACTPTDDGGQPVPTLVRQELNPLIAGSMIEVPLVEGIERVSYTFGIDNAPAAPNGFAAGRGDSIPDRYMARPLAADWPDIVSVRVTILVRAPTPEATYDDQSKTYDLDGNGIPDFRCNPLAAPLPPVACRYKRKVFSQQFQLRNVAQRRGG